MVLFPNPKPRSPSVLQPTTSSRRPPPPSTPSPSQPTRRHPPRLPQTPNPPQTNTLPGHTEPLSTEPQLDIYAPGVPDSHLTPGLGYHSNVWGCGLSSAVRRGVEVVRMFPGTTRRARWGVLLLLALVGSLLFGTAVPVVGQDRAPSEQATYSACVGSATESSGFNDVAWYPAAARAAIDCLAHYNITHGTSTGDFDPGGEVTPLADGALPGQGGRAGRNRDPTSHRSGLQGCRRSGG